MQVVIASDNQITIPKPEIFSWKECLWFLDRGYDDCLFHIEGNTITKALYINKQPMLVSISENRNSLHAICHSRNPTLLEISEIHQFITDWFDMKRNIEPFYRLLYKNEFLQFMPKSFFGLRLIGIPDLFETLCWCIIGQQINLQFAYTLKRRLVEELGETIIFNSGKYYLFPKPEVMAEMTIDQLKDMQFSKQKAQYIINLSQLFISGAISKKELKAAGGYEEMITYLCKIHGVGSWTANYTLMKTLGVMDSITYGDSGLNKALNTLLHFNKKPSKEEVDQFFSDFKGWKAYLVFYLWRSLSAPALNKAKQ